MDALRIERAALLYAPPVRGAFGSRCNREKTDGSDEAATKPGETDEPVKRQRASITEDTALRISYDQDIGRIVVRVLNSESATVVRQLPSEEEVAFLKRFRKAVAPRVDTSV